MATRQRKRRDGPSPGAAAAASNIATYKAQAKINKNTDTAMTFSIKGQPVWLVLAVASGACAAINGVFAKLTTTTLTSTFAAHLATLLGLSSDNKTINVALRGIFFGLNLLFNGVMWALFTTALTRGDSTTRVSIVNVSANFFITAILGWAIFDEKLPLTWWMGAGLLAAGNVVIGSREKDEKKPQTFVRPETTALMSEVRQDNPLGLNGTTIPKMRYSDEENRLNRGEEADAPI